MKSFETEQEHCTFIADWAIRYVYVFVIWLLLLHILRELKENEYATNPGHRTSMQYKDLNPAKIAMQKERNDYFIGLVNRNPKGWKFKDDKAIWKTFR